MTFVHPSENRHEPVSFSTYEDHSTGKDIEERQMKKLNRHGGRGRAEDDGPELTVKLRI